MHILAALSFIIQIICAVHAYRHGNERWIYFIILVPGIGCTVYFITEILPGLRHSREARIIKKGIVRTLDPQREVRMLKENLEISDTLENRLALADACLEAGHFDESIEIYSSALKIEQNEPRIMEKLATACFASGQYEQARQVLEEIIQHNPEYKSVDGHLLYARTLEALGDTNAASAEYDVLLQTFPGEEARCRYALMLKQKGRLHDAAKLFDEILLRARRSPKYYRTAQKYWIKTAKENI